MKSATQELMAARHQLLLAAQAVDKALDRVDAALAELGHPLRPVTTNPATYQAMGEGL